MKKLITKHTNPNSHWVGDGFPVRSIFSYHDLGQQISPFLLMDYAGPYEFEPTDKKRGVGEHPHRGFETVTIVYSGEVEHRDSAGGGGIINDGDVQWMTAASGLVHEEFHGASFAKAGGTFEMIQLWVNLPKASKMVQPRYQGIKSDQIPVVEFGDSKIRVIAGELDGVKGSAMTYSPVNLWDIQARKSSTLSLRVPSGHTASLFVLSGELSLADNKSIQSSEIGIFENEGELLEFTATRDSKVLFLGGEPIDEPVVGYGPFVMNSKAEIKQAIIDFESGKMGRLAVKAE